MPRDDFTGIFNVIALQQRLSAAMSQLLRAGPGVLVCCALGGLAMVLTTIGGTGVVWALVIGMALATVWSPPTALTPGIDVSSKLILRVGVALLGSQISSATLHVVDLRTVAALAGSVLAILLAGRMLGWFLELSRELALIAASSVAICGASAAVAFGLMLSRGETGERDVACTVGAVSLISMAAMLLYPPLAHALGFDATTAGVFLGGTIQEVPHAVAAGYAMDPVTGSVATMIKLLRVALLGPALMLVMSTHPARSGETGIPLLRPPPFLLAFIAFAMLSASGLLPAMLAVDAGWLSRLCIVVAMAAIGLKLQWRNLTAYGWRPAAMLVLLSILLVAMVASFLMFARN